MLKDFDHHLFIVEWRGFISYLFSYIIAKRELFWIWWCPDFEQGWIYMQYILSNETPATWIYSLKIKTTLIFKRCFLGNIKRNVKNQVVLDAY